MFFMFIYAFTHIHIYIYISIKIKCSLLRLEQRRQSNKIKKCFSYVVYSLRNRVSLFDAVLPPICLISWSLSSHCRMSSMAVRAAASRSRVSPGDLTRGLTSGLAYDPLFDPPRLCSLPSFACLSRFVFLWLPLWIISPRSFAVVRILQRVDCPRQVWTVHHPRRY